MAYSVEDINAALLADPEFTKADEATQREWASNAYKNAGFMADGNPVVGGGVNRPLSTKEQVSGAARMTLEGVPAAAAGMLVPPPLNIPAAGLAFAAGSQAADMLDVGMGLRAANPIGQQALDAAKNTLFGSTLEGVARLVTAIGARGVEAITAPFHGAMDDVAQMISGTYDARSRARLLEEASAKSGKAFVPTAAEITQNKALAKVESVLDYIPFSTGELQKNRLGQLNFLIKERESMLEGVGSQGEDNATLGRRIQERVDKLIQDFDMARGVGRDTVRQAILAKLGSSESFEALGRGTQESVMQARETARQGVNDAFAYARRQVPAGKRIQPTHLVEAVNATINETPSNIRGTLPPLVENLKSSGNPELEAALKQIEALPQAVQEKLRPQLVEQYGESGYTVEGFAKVRDAINQALTAEKQAVKGGTATPNAKLLTTLKNALKADEEEFYQSIGGNAEHLFKLARAQSGEYKVRFNAKEVRTMLTSSPDKVLDVSIVPNNPTRVDLIKRAMDPGGWAQMSQAFTNKLLGVERDTLRNGTELLKELNRYGRSTLERVYGDKQAVNDLFETARYLSGEGGVNVTGNKFIRDMVRRDPEKVLNHILSFQTAETGAAGASREFRIRELKYMVGDEGWRDVQELYLADVLKKNKYGIVSPATLSTTLFKQGDGVVREILGKEKADALLNLGKVAQTQQLASKLAENRSGTGQALITYQSGMMILHDPVHGGILAILPDMAAKLYLSDFGRRWLTEGFRVSSTSKEAVTIFNRIVGYSMSATQKSRSAREPEPQRKPLSLSELQP